MNNPRETVYAALFSRLNALKGTNLTAVGTDAAQTIRTVSRRLKSPQEVPPTEQPAIFLCQVSEDVKPSPPTPNKWTLKALLWVYVYNDSDQGPAPYMNQMLDLIESALKPAAMGVMNQGKNTLATFTLGQTMTPLVEDCRIAGTIKTDEGWLGPQSVAIVPIDIITT